MRYDIDYTLYDPERYGLDHPDDPKVQEVLDGARRVAERVARVVPHEPETNQAQTVERAFGEYENDQQRFLDEYQKGQRHQFLRDFLKEHRRDLEKMEQEFLKTHHDPTDQLVYRENMNNQTRAVEDGVRKGQIQEFNDRMEQLTHQQAIQREHISREVGKVQDRTMTDLGLIREAGTSEQTSAEPTRRRARFKGRDDRDR